MSKETRGKVIAVKKQWWLKINSNPVRLGAADGAVFPYIIKVEYNVDDKVYTKRKWIGAGCPVPMAGSYVTVMYDDNDPSRARVV